MFIQSAYAGAPLPITKLQSRQWPEDVVTQRIFDQLSAAMSMQRFDATGRPPPLLPLSDVWYSLRPYSTEYEGLCEIDNVVFLFHATGPLDGAKTKTRATSIEIHRSYYLNTPPSQFAPINLNETAIPQSDEDCGKVDVSKVTAISADSPGMAWKAFWLASEVIRQSGHGKPAFVIECGTSDCGSSVSDLKARDIWSAENCSKAGPGGECMEVYLRDASASLIIAYDLHGDDATIVSVALHDLVTTADPRAD